MPISPNFTSIYRRSFQIDFFDCSPDGHIKLSSLSRLIQYVASEHAVEGGISFWDMQPTNQAWVVNKFRIEIEEKELPKWQDDIDIVTWIEKLDGFRSIRNFEVYMGDVLIANASSMWVIINTVKRRPELMALPHDHFIKYPDKHTIKNNFQIPPKTPLLKIDDNRVRYSDLDMVNHVTNIKYIDWIMDSAYAKGIDLQHCRTIDMLFKKEMTYGQNFDVSYGQDEQGHHFTIQTDEKTTNFYCFFS
ncbi:acyl-[acyl-carrier-protein] thioesterase [Myroides pelagicus]|uniref:Acyl-ACP thioesterase n=1 Tax=Myroides pelagicus TaxID=270914 RepID=A0A7K1GN28_9FLAO|nr:acyl-ACP thioesterase domain-containing protein [Myroides pelagicus]MEC4113950.1 acyl-ACP thioesterase domain-containing protein [Myroides pelagicus]MTH30218.1 acyl-ACP thioesterase [Myroides pelagicus]